MPAEDITSATFSRYGAYLCLAVPPELRKSAASAAVPQLADRLGLRNEFDCGDGHPPDAIAFLRRGAVTQADISDGQLARANAIVHIASARAGLAKEFYEELTRLLDPQMRSHLIEMVVRPKKYTGHAMHNYAYARQVLQKPAALMPNAFLVPMRKTAEWWAKDWMERHTYFLPRYDASGRMLNRGHALASAPGIPYLMRRTYWNAAEPAPGGEYDFVSYFECSDRDIPRFHETCAALRDVEQNPEWAFVREGPTWHGRRVASWAELFRGNHDET